LKRLPADNEVKQGRQSSGEKAESHTSQQDRFEAIATGKEQVGIEGGTS